jgi:hypothetical protein
MQQFIELAAVRVGAAIQNVCANLDFEVLSLPGGSVIALLLWIYAIAMNSIRRAAAQVHASGATIAARSVASESLPPNGACVGCSPPPLLLPGALKYTLPAGIALH